MKKFSRILSLSLAMMVVLALVIGGTSAQDLKIVTVQFGPSDIPGLDPALTTDSASIQIQMETTPGLSRLNEVTLELDPGMATWDVSEDGLVYTFNIIQDVPWVKYNPESGAVEEVADENGDTRYVTAADFVYGMNRSIEVGAYYGGILGGVMASAEATDTYVLTVTAKSPLAYNANIFGMWPAYAVPAWNVEENGDFAFDGDTIQNYGPFAVKEWINGEVISIIKNPFWPGVDAIPAAAVDEVHFDLTLDVSGGLANFEAGTIDVTGVPSPELDRLKADPVLSQNLKIFASDGIYYYGFNSSKPPTDDVRVRRALSMGFSRQSLIDNVLKSGQQPAFFFSNPNTLVAAPKAEDYPDFVLGEDVDAAKALLAEYMADKGYASVSDIPAVVLMHNESEGHARIAQAIAGMWQDNLGVEVQIQTQEWGTYLDTISGPNADETSPPVWRLGWGQDYPDTNNYLFDVFHQSVSTYGFGWVDENRDNFDALLDQAQVEPDLQARTDLYAQAEFILTNEAAAVIPIYHYSSVGMTQPWIERTYSVLTGQRYEKWDVNLDAKP
jgi:oligopeptide transport system substrate-binding protein